MSYKSMKVLFLILLLSSFSSTIFNAAESLNDVEDKISSIESEYDEKLNDINNKQMQYDDLVQELKDITVQQEVTENEIVETNNEIAQKEAEIKNLREVQIPATEKKAQVSLRVAQNNMNKNMLLTVLSSGVNDDNFFEISYATNKIVSKLNQNIMDLKELVKQANEDEKALEVEKQNLEVQQAELEAQKEYVKDLKSEISYSISQLEDDAAGQKEELEAAENLKEMYEEAGCKGDEVYGVDCAVGVIPESTSGFVRPLEHGTVTNEFGGWNSILGDGQHSGIDLAANTGTPVHPTAPGKVIYSGWTNDGGGNSIILLHVKNGVNYVSRYAHLSDVYVSTGDIVYEGESIGAVGETGSAYGAHLHFEIEQQNQYIWSALENPRNYVNFPALGSSW